MKKKILALVLGIAIVCGIAGIAMAAWDDTKSTGDTLTADEWNAMVTDQKSRLPKDGSEAMSGDLDLGTHNITNWNGNIATPYSGNLKYCDGDGYKLIENRNDAYPNVGFRARSINSGYDMRIYYLIYKTAPTFATELMWGVQEDTTEKNLHLNILGQFFPGNDNDIKLGKSSKRWSDVYAVKGHFNNVTPESGDNTGSIGSSSARWADIYAVNTHWGDLGFTETSYNNRTFKVGDTLVLKVKRFDNETGDTMCIPIPINETPEYKELEQRVEMLEEKLEALESGRR